MFYIYYIPVLIYTDGDTNNSGIANSLKIIIQECLSVFEVYLRDQNYML